jgi:hypothetical protein
MHTEGFENLEEAESESHRTYQSSSETDRLLRENEKLRKSLEKEKFFNKLLDQEIQELKSSPNGTAGSQSDYWSSKKRVSRSAFYTLLFITLVMAGYIGYGIYYDKKFDYLELGKNIPGSRTASVTDNAQPAATPATPANEVSASNERMKGAETSTTAASQSGSPLATTPAPVVKDSVPTIIGDKKTVVTDKQKQKAAVALTPDEEYNEEEVNATIQEETKPVKRPASIVKSAPPSPRTETASTQAVSTQPAVIQPAAIQSAEPRPVIAKYRVTSKANFYNLPDENTMRSTFITASGNKVVNALDDKNGFIYVEYTNDLGFTSKGWLSKTDLTKE